MLSHTFTHSQACPESGPVHNFSQLISNACIKTLTLPLGFGGLSCFIVTDLFSKVAWHISTKNASKKFYSSISWERSTSHADIQRRLWEDGGLQVETSIATSLALFESVICKIQSFKPLWENEGPAW